MRFSTTWNIGGKHGSNLARIGDATALPGSFTARWEYPEDHTVEMDVAAENGSIVCNAIRVIRHPDRPSLSGPEMRRIPFESWLDFACVEAGLRQHHGAWTPTGDDRSSREGALADVRRARQRRDMTDDHLREVARIYRANVRNAPREAVARAFTVQPSTAARYIKLARERRFLGKATKGKAGER